MKPADVKPSTCIDFNKENNKEGTKFKVRISKYKNIFVNGYVPNSSEEVFVIKKLQRLCHGHI